MRDAVRTGLHCTKGLGERDGFLGELFEDLIFVRALGLCHRGLGHRCAGLRL